MPERKKEGTLVVTYTQCCPVATCTHHLEPSSVRPCFATCSLCILLFCIPTNVRSDDDYVGVTIIFPSLGSATPRRFSDSFCLLNYLLPHSFYYCGTFVSFIFHLLLKRHCSLGYLFGSFGLQQKKKLRFGRASFFPLFFRAPEKLSFYSAILVEKALLPHHNNNI